MLVSYFLTRESHVITSSVRPSVCMSVRQYDRPYVRPSDIIERSLSAYPSIHITFIIYSNNNGFLS